MSNRKSNLRQWQMVTAGDMSAAITSDVTNIQFLDNIGIQLNFTGTPTGTFQVQVSADFARDDGGRVTNAGNWIPLVLSPVPAATGTAGFIYIDIIQTSAPWIRVTYSGTGAGSLNAFITAKMI